MAQTDYFLKLDGIEGESRDEKHKDELEIESWSWGATQAGTMALGGGGGTGKVQFQEFHFTNISSKASPMLMKACATGQHIKMAVLTCRKAGGESGGSGVEFYKLTLTDVLVSSYQTGAGGGSEPQDQAALNFAKIEFSFTPQDATGKPTESVRAGWDLKANKAV